MGRTSRLFIAIAILCVFLSASLAGCAHPVAPHQQQHHGTETTMRAEGVEKSKFKNAWEKLKDIFKSTSVAVALEPFKAQVDGLRAELDKIDPAFLNDDEKSFLSRFQDVHRCLADSAVLWTIDSRSRDLKCEGIPVYQDGEPVSPEIDEIVERYGLAATDGPDSGIRCVPGDSVRILWDKAFADTQEWLHPILR